MLDIIFRIQNYFLLNYFFAFFTLYVRDFSVFDINSGIFKALFRSLRENGSGACAKNLKFLTTIKS